MDTVFIKDLQVKGVLGVHDREREHPQDIIINIQLSGEIMKAGATDSITDTVDYETVANSIRAYVEISSHYTVEALAAEISKICLKHPLVSIVKVRVEKPGAVKHTRSVGIEIERKRSTT